ncbi:tryptophan synthase subunit alpha [Portibacter lacus]|uniref:Tryptophan synthase alpha chain n=1 Tax=Portibacter lacus TaxID=1099794 RepID=A0AA37SR79_9BACT|nr:tryptophan synthase subunit alpha [Portibacter lacus]GLR19291.1 tryptophan synthase alpha chain [Portibacter lacus]
MNKKFENLFEDGKKLLSIYITAGYPSLNDTVPTLIALEKNGVDFVEIGMPYSDPMADGTTIQQSSEKAIKNGMHLDLLFSQIKEARKSVSIPFVYMGYLNQLMQYGLDKFCQACVDSGIDSLIIPDLPMEVYAEEHKAIFEKYNLGLSFLISPQSGEKRIKQADDLSYPFLYQVSSNAITGASSKISDVQLDYFKRIEEMKLKSPKMIGFGISNKETFDQACERASGAIIGSAFIKAVSQEGDLENNIGQFIKSIRE